jgi:hypothetical protein
MAEMVGFHQEMWIVMLESAKNLVLGVDTLGQQVLPCVQYGMLWEVCLTRMSEKLE